MNQELRIKNQESRGGFSIIRSLLRKNLSTGEHGFSIIEMLVSIGVLAIVIVITVQSFSSSLRNSKKSDSISKARENVDFAISSMERLLRNAKSVRCISSTNLSYVDEYNNTAQFVCTTSGADGYVASGSARLTSPGVRVDCALTSFQCTDPDVVNGVPGSVTITVSAEDVNLGTTAEGAVVTSKTKVLLRNYTSL